MICTLMSSMSIAQPNLAFYPLDNQFNSFDYNPAFLTSRKKYTFSIFPLAGTSVGFNNQQVFKDMTSKFLSGEITNDDFREVFNSKVSQSTFLQNYESSLLSFTYRSKIGFFNFRIKESEYFMANLEGEITKFIFTTKINSATIGQSQYLPAQAAHYREYSLGYAYKSPSKRFSAGIRAKLYFGKFAFFSNVSGKIEKYQFNDYVLKTSGIVNVSFPANTISNPNDTAKSVNFSDKKQIFDYLFNTGNPGMGVDLGIKYDVTEALTVSMSIIDLGKIYWKTNLNSRINDGEYPLSKPFVYTRVGEVETISKSEVYSYSDTFDFSRLSSDSSPFSKPLPTSLYAGLKYRFNPGFSLAITDRYIVLKDLNYNSLSVSANFDVNKKLSISSGYSIIGDSYFNVPVAFLYDGNFGQFYLGTDNLASIVNPSSPDFAGISFGACFYLFTKKNMYLKRSELTPFYQPRKIIKRRRTGLIIKAKPED